ncbi:tetratricopeptide repeat protein [Micromonospora profundi]|uniref:Tetratricopeptide repeat protein n=1 Tax=Micromonospora profundi TaxID=1420889 RepID=A0AAJ6HUV7_9ACTN|nr:tetratricopeptide repeat protein [Micromonospora profundi]WLS45438.1 tetratricopeptide repeat protein [Micromonospora profundi]
MPSGFGELTDQAQHLVSAGDLAGAQRLLADALTDADPRPANATPELAEAASLQARVLVALGEPHSARGWAAFTYAASTRLHGRSDPRTVAAAATLAAVLHRVGSHSRAARLYQEVIIELTAQDGPESLRVLAAHADLATVEYARGQCTVARDRLQDAWELHREVYGDGHPSGIKMLARLGAMQRDCGQFTEAHDNLALARELSRQHLPADDPLAQQVAALARAAANPDHVCADDAPAGRDAPLVPAARNPPHDDHPVESGYHPSTSPPQSAKPAPDGPAEADNDPADVTFADSQGFRSDEGFRSDQGFTDDEGFTDGHGFTRGQGFTEGGSFAPAHGVAAGASAVPNPRVPADERGGSAGLRWPPEQADEPTPHSTGTPVPPSVVGFTGSSTEEASGVYRLHQPGRPADANPPSAPSRAGEPPSESYQPFQPSEPYTPGDPYTPPEPYTPSRLLPVPVHRAPPPPRNRLVPVLVAGVVVVLLGTAAVIAGVARVGDGDDKPPAPATGSPSAGPTSPGAPDTSGAAPGGGAPASTPPPAAVPGTPPGSVTLRDNRDNITLRWTYPAGGEGPVIISAGRAGQDKTAIATLPAGADTYIVYALNRANDYCFTVAVVWSTDSVAPADQVCTNRR